MTPFKIIVVIVGWLVSLPLFSFGQRVTTHERYFYRAEDKSLVGNVTVVKKVKDYFDCPFLCLQYGPFTCLSFNFGRNNYHGYHSCEISNSERYYEPHKIQERLGFDYYGTTYEVSWDPINSHFTPNLRDIGPFYTGGCIIRLYGLRKTFAFN